MSRKNYNNNIYEDVILITDVKENISNKGDIYYSVKSNNGISYTYFKRMSDKVGDKHWAEYLKTGNLLPIFVVEKEVAFPEQRTYRNIYPAPFLNKGVPYEKDSDDYKEFTKELTK